MAAEIAGLAASVIAITTAGTAGLKLSKKAFQIAKQLKGAGDEIEIFAHDMRLFNEIITTSVMSLSNFCAKLKPSSLMYQYFKRNRVLKRLAESSRLMGRRIDEVWDTTSMIQSKLKLLTHVKWVFNKSDVLALRPEMESLKSNLQLIATTIMMEVYMGQLEGELPEELRQDKFEEIAELKRQAKVHVRTIEMLLESDERRWNREMQSEDEPRRPRAKASRLQNILIDLGTSMAEHEQVPKSDGALSPTSSSTNTNSSSRRRSHLSVKSTSTASSTSPATSLGSSMHSYSPSQGPLSRSSTTVNSTVVRRGDELHRSTSGVRASRPPQETSRARSLRRKQQQNASSSQPEPVSLTSTVEIALPSRAEQTEDPALEPLQVLTIHTAQSKRPRISGYIIHNWERILTEAVPDSGCPYNFICAAHAARLGLAIKPHNGAGRGVSQPIVIRFEDGHEITSSGVVSFQWSQFLHSNNPPLDVECLVIEEGIENFIPGKPFFEDARRLWGHHEESMF